MPNVNTVTIDVCILFKFQKQRAKILFIIDHFKHDFLQIFISRSLLIRCNYRALNIRNKFNLFISNSIL